MHGWLYLGGAPGRGGLRAARLSTAVCVGAGSDAAAVSVFDQLEFTMVTGKNSAGEMINPGQQLTRIEALRLSNGWFTHEEATLAP